MKLNMPVVLLSALALAAPSATSFAKDNKGNKGKGRVEQRAGDHSHRHDGRNETDRRHADGDGNLTICHVPGGNTANAQTITIGEPAWQAHREQGDHVGACGSVITGQRRTTTTSRHRRARSH